MKPNRRIEVVRGDITRLEVDAVVNAANERLLGGGGVDGAIHRAAGPELLQACRAIPEVSPGVRCPVGESRLTPGFRMAARYVIHTVGPVWSGGGAGEPTLLASCYRSAMALAESHGIESIAFPAISCGVFGYPQDAAAQVAVRTLSSCLAEDPAMKRVLLVAFGEETADALAAALGRD